MEAVSHLLGFSFSQQNPGPTFPGRRQQKCCESNCRAGCGGCGELQPLFPPFPGFRLPTPWMSPAASLGTGLRTTGISGEIWAALTTWRAASFGRAHRAISLVTPSERGGWCIARGACHIGRQGRSVVSIPARHASGAGRRRLFGQRLRYSPRLGVQAHDRMPPQRGGVCHMLGYRCTQTGERSSGSTTAACPHSVESFARETSGGAVGNVANWDDQAVWRA